MVQNIHKTLFSEKTAKKKDKQPCHALVYVLV